MSKKDKINLGILFIVQTIPLIILVCVFIDPRNEMIRLLGLGLAYLLAALSYERMMKEYPNIRKKPTKLIRIIIWTVSLAVILWLFYRNYKGLTLITRPVFAISILALTIIIAVVMSDRIQAIKEVREQEPEQEKA